MGSTVPRLLQRHRGSLRREQLLQPQSHRRLLSVHYVESRAPLRHLRWRLPPPAIQLPRAAESARQLRIHRRSHPGQRHRYWLRLRRLPHRQARHHFYRLRKRGQISPPIRLRRFHHGRLAHPPRSHAQRRSPLGVRRTHHRAAQPPRQPRRCARLRKSHAGASR